jgi:hypothetical protein
MSDDGRTLLAAVTQLRAALEQTGDALATVRLDAMLDSEIALAAALAVLPAERGAVNGEREAVLQELVRARSALTRCRRLGGSLTGLVHRSLGAHGMMGTYGADGRQAAYCSAGTLEARG